MVLSASMGFLEISRLLLSEKVNKMVREPGEFHNSIGIFHRKARNMKKHNNKIPAFILAGSLLSTMGCGANNTADNNGGNTGNNGTQTQNMITEADARQIALQKAGLESATFTKQEYDSHDKEYEFEFHTDSTEYDCDVSANNGTIRSYSTEDRTVLN